MRRPLLLAHRGAHHRARENTVAAFDQALADGCDGFEFDVRRTADGHGIISHDASFQGLKIARHTFAAIRDNKARAGPSVLSRRSSAKDNSDEPATALCCLEDVLRRYNRTAFLDIELKDEGLEGVVAAGLREHRPQRYVVSSFLPKVITVMHTHASAVRLGLIADTRGVLEQWRDLPVSCVVVHRALLSSRLVNELHGAAKQVFVWTVNHQREMLRFAEWGVDGIVSDDTELLRRAFSGI